MPILKSGSAELRRDLGDVAFEYMIDAEQAGFIGTVLMPFKNVLQKKSNYPKIPIEAMFKEAELKRAPRGDYKRDDYEFSTGSYDCEEYGFEDLLDDVERELYASFFDAEVISTQRAMDKVLRAQEKRIANMTFNTTNIPTQQAAAAVWSDATNATPRADVIALKKKMRNNRGIIPNVLALAKSVFDELIETNELREALKYTNPIEIGGEDAQKRVLAQYFGVDRVLTGNAIRDTAKKGKTSSLTDIWDTTLVGLFKIATGENMLEPAIGRTFLWTGDSPESVVVEQYREEQKRSNVYRARQNVDEAFIYTGAGGLVTGV
ncbi:MAG: hypothetical protein D8M57_13210 [Candidatus Scalindua sp. AMX11]|nr:MAG: hypothetical protein DWQ00_11880 [Candidatus Scalindua sp.]NOG83766.1 hypothetical protein [Planctomycetota bacterium]RZV82925.1 MAG: hypothetical protein EX341_09035 [Candidatus Scalindua sp. SCAELEC01]TDE64453.1 MAG: hypothetical protein D8M57_13210 [Candidatus Scalindua sp. AMX11]GJQ59782.1 MAG: hypothetical protein SCALA701_25830 [Candidatus Scalindua sp.]